MLVLIDNYDSFVHNLARYFRRLGQETLVLRNDGVTAGDILALAPAAIVISPGPCTPGEAGCSVDVVRQAQPDLPILGVCLGHQAIAAALGARVIRASQPRHGRTSVVTHNSSQLFGGIPSPFVACRYHSLVVDEASLPKDTCITARAEDDGAVMALEHASRPLFGVQFHPEAILTEHGYRLLANFLAIAGCTVTGLPQALAAGEHLAPTAPAFVPPPSPVTF